MAFNNVPVNGWPQIKDLEKLDAIASQIENMPTFTSNDKAFLEDLPSYPATDGTKMLTATTTSGNTSLSYEDIPEELPTFPQSDGEKVLTATTTSGETVLSWESKASSINYSTTEQATGQKWIDGKDIYFKVYTANLTNNSNVLLEEDFGLTKEIVVLQAVISTANGQYQYPCMGYCPPALSEYAFPGVVNNNLVVAIKDDFSSYAIKAVIYYTKKESEV